jgi:hypothetical protein
MIQSISSVTPNAMMIRQRTIVHILCLVFFREHDIPVGVPAANAPEPRLLPALYQVDESGEGDLQARRLEIRLATLGHPQKQARDELRDDGQSSEVSCVEEIDDRDCKLAGKKLELERC